MHLTPAGGGPRGFQQQQQPKKGAFLPLIHQRSKSLCVVQTGAGRCQMKRLYPWSTEEEGNQPCGSGRNDWRNLFKRMCTELAGCAQMFVYVFKQNDNMDCWVFQASISPDCLRFGVKHTFCAHSHASKCVAGFFSLFLLRCHLPVTLSF